MFSFSSQATLDLFGIFRFYRRATDREPKQIRQISEKKLGHDPIWLLPEPDPNADEIYLFEGEPDCLCALSIGLNATTVTGGAGTFRDDFLPYFKDKKVFVCYDVDQKGRIGAKLVAKQIARVARETKIVKLDLDPEKHPKGDFNDYIAKEHKTKEDYLKLCELATPSVAVPEHVNVDEEDNRYYKVIETGGEVEQKTISNFVIRLVCRLMDPDGKISREIELLSDTGKKSGNRIIDPEQMSSLLKFRTFCFECGDYMFKGDEKDLGDIRYLVAAQDVTSKVVKQVPMSGFFINDNIWIFKGMAIKDGKIIDPDDNGVFWVGDTGYSHIPIEFIGKDYITKNIPSLISSERLPGRDIMIRFLDLLARNIGNPQVGLGLALAVGASHYLDIIRAPILGCFPILFVYGSLQSGKTELVTMFMHLWVLSKQDAESLPTMTLTVPISRRLCYNSCIPSWWDEYRENTVQKNGIMGAFRNAYDGIGRTLGAKERGIHCEPVRSPVILSGEQVPLDEALRSRFIPIRMFPSGKDVSLYEETIDMSYWASFSLFEIIKNKNTDSVSRLVSKMLDYKDRILHGHERMDERTAKNYAIALGFYNEFINPEDRVLEDLIINGDDVGNIRRDEIDEQDPHRTQAMDEFIDSVQNLIESGKIKECVSWYDIDLVGKKVYIWLAGICGEYQKEQRSETGLPGIDQRTISNHFKDMSCYLEHSQKKLRPRGDSRVSVNKRCVVLSLEKIPKKLLGWFGGDTCYDSAMDIVDEYIRRNKN